MVARKQQIVSLLLPCQTEGELSTSLEQLLDMHS